MTVFLDGGASRARQAFRLADHCRLTVAGQRRNLTGFPWTSNAVIYLWGYCTTANGHLSKVSPR
jgi:hypothetical protein